MIAYHVAHFLVDIVVLFKILLSFHHYHDFGPLRACLESKKDVIRRGLFSCTRGVCCKVVEDTSAKIVFAAFGCGS